jgi:hypothetical protein
MVASRKKVVQMRVQKLAMIGLVILLFQAMIPAAIAAPDTFSAISLTDETDNGASQEDNWTNNPHPVLTFTGPADAEVFIQPPSGDAYLIEGVHYTKSFSDGTYTITFTDAKADGTENDPYGDFYKNVATNNPPNASDGGYYVFARVNGDPLSNLGMVYLDTFIHSNPLYMDAKSDNGPANNDSITSDPNPYLTFTGEANLRIRVVDPEGNDLVEGESFQCTEVVPGSYSIAMNDLTLDGTYVFYMIDQFKNEVREGAFTLKAIPPLLTNFVLEESTDTGTIGDFITSDATAIFKMDTAPNLKIRVTDPAGNVLEDGKDYKSAVDWQTYAIYMSGEPTLIDGTYQVSAIDEYGLETTTDAFVLDRAPEKFAVSEPLDGATIASHTPTIGGIGEPGTLVTVVLEDQKYSATVDKSGEWAIQIDENSPLQDGDYVFVVTVQDEAGNVSSEKHAFTVGETKEYLTKETEKGTGSKQTDNQAVRRTVTDTHSAYLKGYPDGTFKPNRMITRAEFATILARTTANVSVKSVKSAKDVPSGHWANAAVKKVIKLGLMKADKTGKFHPTRKLTKAEFYTALAKLTGKSYKKSRYNKATLSRLQLVVNYNKALGRGPLTGVKKATFKDVPRSLTGFGAVEEAARTHTYSVVKGVEKLK